MFAYVLKEMTFIYALKNVISCLNIIFVKICLFCIEFQKATLLKLAAQFVYSFTFEIYRLERKVYTGCVETRSA